MISLSCAPQACRCSEGNEGMNLGIPSKQTKVGMVFFQGSFHLAVGQKWYPKWLALVSGTKDENLRSISWCFNSDPYSFLIPSLSQGRHLSQDFLEPTTSRALQWASQSERSMASVSVSKKTPASDPGSIGWDEIPGAQEKKGRVECWPYNVSKRKVEKIAAKAWET